jgi:hypothetical protein
MVERIQQQHRSKMANFIEVVKPSRWLGAVWTSDLVDNRRAVTMCPSCYTRYKNWWKPAEYHPNWNEVFVINCDGCSARDVLGVTFLPEEGFYTAFTKTHGTAAGPFRKLFF